MKYLHKAKSVGLGTLMKVVDGFRKDSTDKSEILGLHRDIWGIQREIVLRTNTPTIWSGLSKCVWIPRTVWNNILSNLFLFNAYKMNSIIFYL